MRFGGFFRTHELHAQPWAVRAYRGGRRAAAALGVDVVLRTFLTTLLLTPVMTYVVLPRVTRALEWWLHGRPAPWRARRGAGAPG